MCWYDGAKVVLFSNTSKKNKKKVISYQYIIRIVPYFSIIMRVLQSPHSKI